MLKEVPSLLRIWKGRAHTGKVLSKELGEKRPRYHVVGSSPARDLAKAKADLAKAALMFMDRHAAEVLHHEAFLSLSESAVKSIISRDSFCAAEVRARPTMMTPPPQQ